jgi:hypothetical protein
MSFQGVVISILLCCFFLSRTSQGEAPLHCLDGAPDSLLFSRLLLPEARSQHGAPAARDEAGDPYLPGARVKLSSGSFPWSWRVYGSPRRESAI